MTRRNSRIAFVQALYQWDMSGFEDEEAILAEFLEYRDGKVATWGNIGGKFEPEFFKELFKYSTTNIKEIDALIISLLPESWPFDRINKITLSILRSGASELKYFPNTPFKVIINEYIDISKNFGAAEKETGFINGILNAISDNIRAHEKNNL